jgi:hypothetical protein
MRLARRVKLSAAQRADMWNRWKAGQSLHEIARALGKDHAVIQFLLARRGGDSSDRPSALAANAHTGGAGRSIPRTRVCACPTKPFTAAYSSGHAEC